MRHINIPIFVPHLGCPHTCVFCNQHTITGQKTFDPTMLDEIVSEQLSYVDPEKDELQIAFFGGSFTAIERPLMLALLDKAESYVKQGTVSSIRLSTRPDAIDEEILTLLSRYSVRSIELGIQSTDDAVLSASERGHTAADSHKACRLVKAFGFELVGQMMLGLPASTQQSEEETACRIALWGADAARIYPTIVFRDTALDEQQKNGSYTPLTVEEAVRRAAAVYELLRIKGVEVIRIGLCETDGLRQNTITGGAYHPAFGELVLNEYYKKQIQSALDGISFSRTAELTIETAPCALSQAIGQKKKNYLFLKEKYPENRIQFCPSSYVADKEVKIIVKEN